MNMAEDEIKTFLRGSSNFSKWLHSFAAATENSFVSSHSIHSVLTLISQDPWFYSKTVLNQLLHIQDVNKVAEYYQHVLALLGNVNDVDLLLANKVFFKSNYELEEIFKSRLTSNFMYDVSSTDFSTKEQTAELISDCIKHKTANKINNMVHASSLEDETCVALLNSLYFSGKWAEPFNAADAVPATFYLSNTEQIEIQMMRKKSEFYYKNDMSRGLKILQLPYVNNDISLVVILPNNKSVWNSFDIVSDLTTLTEGMTKQTVDVSLPKFRIEGTVELKNGISQMGIEEVFNADLINIINGEEVNLNNVQQKVFVDVNEGGSEVAAGTMSLLSKAKEKQFVPKRGVLIYEMNVKSDISNRFAKTNVVWRTKNIEAVAREAVFKVVLTETAFITEFIMEIGGKSYKSYIRQKEEAKTIYNKALAQGQSAGLVEAKTRDSKEFSVSVNLEPNSVAVFSLSYEEMLQRVQDQYELVLNICPGQIVDDLHVGVHIAECKPLKFVKTPAVRSGNDISKTESEKYLDPLSEVNIINSKTATVKFSPNSKRQKMIAHYLGGSASDGMSGQFVVQYDVERDPQDGQVLLQDGYFVHFFAPNDLDPLPKHVVFALDTSGSMGGRKLVQLQEAMISILGDIRTNDIINIVEFNSYVTVWDINSGTQTILPAFYQEEDFQDPFNKLRSTFMPDFIYANEETIRKAKNVVGQLKAFGSTYIIGALEAALYLVKKVQDTIAEKSEKYQPIIIFLTDGEPNVGISEPNRIVEIVTKVNQRYNKVPIFSLSFGYGADKNFLRRLSLKNQGFSRHIYEAADASLQLQEFYKEVSSPLLSDIHFKYDTDVQQVTRTYFPIYFRGSELVVSGRCRELHFPTYVNCWGLQGPIVIQSSIETPATSLERLWAYLTVKQLLDKRDSVDDKTELTRKAIALALKYSFVTDVTSLVVVKPDEPSTMLPDDRPIGHGEGQLPEFWQPTGDPFRQSQTAFIPFQYAPSTTGFGQSASFLPQSGIDFGQSVLFSPQSGTVFGQSASSLSQQSAHSGNLFGQTQRVPPGQPTALFGSANVQGYSSSFLQQTGALFGQSQTASIPSQYVQSATGFGQSTSFLPQSGTVFGQSVSFLPQSGTVFDQSASFVPRQTAYSESFFGQAQSSSLGQPTALFRSANVQDPSPNSGFSFTSTGFTIDLRNQPSGTFGSMQIEIDEDKKQPQEFVADRPFLVILQFKKENKVVILLNGCVTKPTY